ncbi:MAG: cupin domain-containing protein [Bacteroidota bacterium]
MEIEKVNVAEKLNQIQDHWSPKIIGLLNNQAVKIAKFKGEFIMHHHENEDELFFVIEGKLFMQLKEKTLEVLPGEFVIIPKGVEHKPYAEEETSVLLFEPNTTVNTGNITNDRTLTDLERI